jgi:hypothetical protein
MPDADHPARVFDEAPLTNAHILTMVLCPDGFWQAWSLSDHFPSAEEVGLPS